MAKHQSKPDDRLEFHPDAWERFERAAKAVAKSPPKHRPAAKRKSKTKQVKK